MIVTKIIMPINDRMKPAMARPLGALNKPMKENKAPKNQIRKLAIGAQHKAKANIAKTKPAVPRPLEREP